MLILAFTSHTTWLQETLTYVRHKNLDSEEAAAEHTSGCLLPHLGSKYLTSLPMASSFLLLCIWILSIFHNTGQFYLYWSTLSRSPIPNALCKGMVYYPQAWAWPGTTSVSHRAVSLETAMWNYTWSAGAVSWPWASMTNMVKNRLVGNRDCAFSVLRTFMLILALICGSCTHPYVGEQKKLCTLITSAPSMRCKFYTYYHSCLVLTCKAKLTQVLHLELGVRHIHSISLDSQVLTGI